MLFTVGTIFINWRKRCLGHHVELPVSSVLVFGSIVLDWFTCYHACKDNEKCVQVVFQHTGNCYPMSQSSDDDHDGKGGENYNWISAQFDRSASSFSNSTTG